MNDDKKPKATSVRFSAETKVLFDQRQEQSHFSKSDLICLAVERCLADNHWKASPAGSDPTERDQVFQEVLIDLSQIITKLAFSVEEALQGKSRIRRLEARNLVFDAFVELESARKKLNVY